MTRTLRILYRCISTPLILALAFRQSTYISGDVQHLDGRDETVEPSPFGGGSECVDQSHAVLFSATGKRPSRQSEDAATWEESKPFRCG
ncbi:hypothetical protein GGR54DRAFT_550345 [Hypoxylon sp. NC1633]|nr:hypothetical protein GGR54DRAFT_550345 [Hypoxylon sp. NC1633]